VEVLQFAVGEPESGRDAAPGGNEQESVGNREVPLRRYTTARTVAAVRMFDHHVAGRLVDPASPAASRVKRVNEDAFRRPEAGREVDGVIGDDRAAARGPARHDAVVAQDHAVRRAAAFLPELPAVRGREAV
jgi:hypothetical protein